MYYQNYEDYMRSILGYPRDIQDTYQTNYFEDERNSNYLGMYQDTRDLENLYPNIYKCINPYVVDVCSKCSGSVTRDILEDMVEEVYKKVENNNEVMININIVNDSAIISREAENRSTEQNTTNTSNSQNTQNISNMSRTHYCNNAQNIPNESLKRGMREQENKENRETRQRRPNNPFLRDLIRILILNRLLNNYPNRPNPPRPPRPPMPPRPPRPGYRGDFDDYLRF